MINYDSDNISGWFGLGWLLDLLVIIIDICWGVFCYVVMIEIELYVYVG